MKTAIVLSAMVLLSATQSAHAEARIYTASVRFLKSQPGNPRPQFSDIEQSGVVREAEKKALYNCQAARAQGCHVIASEITKCNVSSGWFEKTACEASATAEGTL